MRLLITVCVTILMTSCSDVEEVPETEVTFDIVARGIRSSDKNSLPLNDTAESPNGDFTVSISSNAKTLPNSDQKWWYASLSILNKNGDVMFEDNETYALWFPFRVRWIDSTSLELYSGDVGERNYRLENNQWVKDR